jgi:hypothetical protein
LSSHSRSMIRCSFSIAFSSRSARPLALSANDCHSTTRSSTTLQSCMIKQTSNVSWATYRHCVIDGDDAGPQGMHVLVIFKLVLLPRGVIPINCARGNLGLEDEDGGTCAPDVSGPPGARSI